MKGDVFEGDALAKSAFEPLRLIRRMRSGSRASERPIRVTANSDPVQWPEHLQIILSAVAGALAGKPLLPQLLSLLEEECCHVLPEHIVSLTHEPKGGNHPSRAIYRIVVRGPRFDALWSYTPGQFASAIKAAKTYTASRKS